MMGPLEEVPPIGTISPPQTIGMLNPTVEMSG